MSLSERSNRITKLLTSTKSRASYIKAKLGVLVPAQIRALRLKSNMPRQKDLAQAAEMHQSRISMFETPGMANVTLETLARLAATFKVGLVVKFVPFHEMLRWENDFSQDDFDVIPRIDQDEAFINPAASAENNRSAMAAAAGIGANGLATDERKPQGNVQDIQGASGLASYSNRIGNTQLAGELHG
jgi:transcriptional regulator with XRE-family HTH domain